MLFAGKTGVEAMCRGIELLFANGTGDGEEEHLRGNRVACTSSHVKQIWVQPLLLSFSVMGRSSVPCEPLLLHIY